MEGTGALLAQAFDSPLRDRSWISGSRQQMGENNAVPEPASFDQVVLSGTSGAVPAPAGDFASLSGADRSRYAQILKTMHLNGQLFVKEEDGRLRRANPMEIRQELDGDHSRAMVVTALATTATATQDSRDSFEAKAGGLLLWCDASASRTASDEFSVSQSVHYTSSPLKEWADLELAVPDAGVTGTPFLPQDGGAVTRSLHWEQEWLERSASSSEIGGGFLGAGISGTNNEGRTVTTGQVHR